MSEVSEADAHTLFGEQAEWGFAIPWEYQALADPAGGRPMLRPPRSGDDLWSGALAYWGSLLHLLVYGFGWSRPDRGLRWWYDAGKPTHDLKLALLSEVWEADGQLCWRSAKVAFCDQRKSRSQERVRPELVTLAAALLGGVGGGGGEGLVFA
jgi:hypothetical protein